MTLEKQIINVDFGRGLDTKRDEVTVVPGNLVLLQNGQFDKVGAINKRLPFAELTASANTPVGSLPAAKKLLPFKQGLNAITDRQTYQSNPNRPDAPNEFFYYNEQQDFYARNGEAQSAVIQSFPIVGDIGELGEYIVFDTFSRNNLTYHLIKFNKLSFESTYIYVTNSLDETISELSLVSDFAIDTACARFALIGNSLYVFYNSSFDANLRYKSFNANNAPISLSAATILVTDLGATEVFDVCTDNANTFAFIAYDSSTPNVTNVKRFDGSSITHSNTIADDATQAISIAYETVTGPSLLVTYANSSNEVRSENFSATLVSYATNFLISAEAVAILSLSVHGTQSDFSTNGWPVLWTITAAATIDVQTKSALIGLSSVLDAVRVWRRSVAINSRIFYFNNNHYIFAIYRSELQSTSFLFQLSGWGANYKSRVVGRYFSEQARESSGYACRPSVSTIGNTVRFMSVANKFFRPLSYYPRYGDGLYEIVVYLTDVRNFSSIEAGDNLHVVGGLLSMFDSQTMYEHSFTHYPETPTLVPFGIGAMTALGTYQYTIVFEWTDQFGQTHKSAPATPATIVLGVGITSVEVIIPCYRITNRGDNEVTARMFRTTNLGTNFQEVLSVSVPYSSDTVTLIDGLSDADLATRAFLYTTGGVLENVAASPSWHSVTWKERVCLMTENGVQFSKKRQDGNPIEFSDAFFIQIETDGGRGIGLGVLDDKLIVFKKNKIYYITGEGANDTGTFGRFSDPISIITDAGCVNPRSIVSTDKGVVFQASTGFYILLRNLTVVYIGAGVEYFTLNQPVITASALLESANQARFLTESGECLVYDYLIEQWSVFTNHAGADLAVYKNKAVRITSSNKVVIETPNTTYADFISSGLVEYTLKLRTGWLSFADVQGFMRVYRFLLLGKFKSHHTLTVKVAYDYNPKVIDTYSFNTNGAGKSLTVIPEAAIYGDTAFSGADIYQFRGHLSKQKCEAVQLTIEDTSLSGTKESYSLTKVAFEVGIKGSVFKKPAAFSNV